MEIFSARLKFLRERKGLTQKELADLVGMSPQGYGKIENGQREPKLEVLAALPEILDESTDFLLGVTDFDQHGERLMLTYEQAYTNVLNAEHDIIALQVNPHNELMIRAAFNPDDENDVSEQIKRLEKFLSVWKLRRDQTLPKLKKYMETIPLASKTYKKRLQDLEDWKDIFNTMHPIESSIDKGNHE